MGEILNHPVTGPSAWTRDEIAADQSWIYQLSGDDIAELEAAVDGVRAKGLSLFEFTQDDFPLPGLASMVAGIVDQLENGRGCALIRGLNTARYDEETLKILYWGFGQHWGAPISQNARGQLIGHVCNRGRDYQSRNVRGYTTNARISPHCDPADSVSLLCAHPAKSGGESEIASAMSIYNYILEHHPDYLEPLTEGFHFDLRGEGVTEDPDEVTFNKVPVFSYFDGKLSCRFNGKTIIDGQAKAGAPLDGIALEAVNKVGELAHDPKYRFDLAFQQGDIQILNNYLILHARGDFEDHPEPDRRRNLLRLWTNLHHGRKLAPEFAERLNTGPRGGVMIRPEHPEGIRHEL